MTSAEPADRGRLTIDPLVVRKIAQRAADQANGTTTVQRTLAGVAMGAQGSTVTVDGDGSVVALRVELALHYPASVREVVAGVRSAVTEEVERITSYRVRGIDVVVSALLPDIRARVE